MSNPTISRFKDIKLGEPIEVVEMVRAFKEDPHRDKVNCSIGGYLNTETEDIHLFNAVRRAEESLASDPHLHHAYLPTLGYPEVNKAAIGLLLGDSHSAIQGRDNSSMKIQFKSKHDFNDYNHMVKM